MFWVGRLGICIFFVFGFHFAGFSQERKGGFLFSARYMLPFTSPPEAIRSADGFGVSLGYGRMSLNENPFQWQIFAGLGMLSYNPSTTGATEIHTGSTVISAGFTPEYRLLPTDGWDLYIACQLKIGSHIGDSKVNYYSGNENKEEQQHVFAGWKAAISPLLKLQAPLNDNLTGSFFIGWDSTDFGRGMRKLKSDFYDPYTFKASVIYAGVSFVFSKR